eukprot:5791713-Amphidinium_carterae.1
MLIRSCKILCAHVSHDHDDTLGSQICQERKVPTKSFNPACGGHLKGLYSGTLQDWATEVRRLKVTLQNELLVELVEARCPLSA